MKPKIWLLLLLTFSIFHLTTSIATVRYVSKTGSSTPPYTSWETAADSIQKCINVSQFGDTIYVANGIYKEQVIMIPGLSLIGAGMDSCVIDTRDYIFSTGEISVSVNDSCLLRGFLIIVANNTEYGRGIGGSGGSSSLVTLNRVTNAKYGIFIGGDVTIYKNVCDNISSGIYTFNSNSLVRKNIINANIQSAIVAGIRIEAFDFTYKPVIDSNYIETDMYGIRKSIGSRPTITNNIIKIKDAPEGIFLGFSDSAQVYNNLIISENGGNGINNSAITNLQVYNNFITGSFYDNDIYWAIRLGAYNAAKNNVVTNAVRGIKATVTEELIYQYNNVWNTEIEYSGFTPDSTNLSVDPMIINDDSTQGELDFHLQKYSPLIDAGDPAMIDKDSSRIDIGLYGGLFGEVYKYQDLAPRPPRNVIAVLDTAMITVKWNKNTEADFSEYKLFRDTVADFTADSTTFVLSLTDTNYSHLTPPNVETYYYKLTAVDNQGNESGVSEEIAVKITAIDDYPTIVSDYRLYQNYPNPFNPSTTIAYKLKERGYVKLYVYDIKGELITTLVNQNQESGYYEVEFNSSGINDLSSGVYIYQLIVKSESNISVFSDIKKMIVVK